MFFTVDPRKELVAFGVRRGRDIINFLGMNYNEDHIVCTGPVGSNGSEVVINTSTRFELKDAKETPITCRRKFIEKNGIRFLPATEISISAEGAAPLIVPLPRDQKFEPSYASQLNEQLNDLERRLANNQTELSNAIGKVDSKYENRIEDFDLSFHMVMRGQYSGNAIPTYDSIGCGNVNSYRKSKCGDSPYVLKRTHIRSGGNCGYAYYTLICIKK